MRACSHRRWGFPEDPATGAAAAAFAGAVAMFDKPPDGIHSGIIEQGYEMGRPSDIFQEIEMEGGKPHEGPDRRACRQGHGRDASRTEVMVLCDQTYGLALKAPAH